LSRITAFRPIFWASMAQARPVGPAPMTNTSVQLPGREAVCRRGKVTGVISVVAKTFLNSAGALEERSAATRF